MTIEEMLKEAQVENKRLEKEASDLRKQQETHDADLKAAQDLAEEAQAAQQKAADELKAEQEAHATTQASLKQANSDLADAKASLKTVHDTLKSANLTLGTGENEKPLAEQIRTQASAKAAEIVGGQGADAALDTGAGTTSNSTEGKHAQDSGKPASPRERMAGHFAKQTTLSRG